MRAFTGQDLRRLREATGTTQDDLARYLGLNHRSQVSRMESGFLHIRGARLILIKQFIRQHRVPGFEWLLES